MLAFDYDGVLSPIVGDPELAVAHPPAIAALRRVAVRVGTLAVITGRPADVVVRLGRFGDYPELAGLVVFGHYGRERWEVAQRRDRGPTAGPGVAAVRAEVPAVLAGLGSRARSRSRTRGARSPCTPGALSIPPACSLCSASRSALSPIATASSWSRVGWSIEMRPPGFDKGSALLALVAERGGSSVAYAGDDLGDLAAFGAVDRMREAGLPGLKVCSGSAEVPELRPSADIVVDGPAGIADFLDRLADQLGAETAG